MDRRRKDLLALHGVIPARAVDLKRVRYARGLSSITQGQAAEQLGLELAHFSDIECGRAPMEPGRLERLAEIYSVRIAWLQGQNSSRQQIMVRSGITEADLAKLKPLHRDRYLADLDAIA